MRNHGLNIEDIGEEYQGLIDKLKLGAKLGRISPKICDGDKGELRIATVCDPKRERVIVGFGTECQWLGFTWEDAIEFGNILISRGIDLAKIAARNDKLESKKWKENGNGLSK